MSTATMGVERVAGCEVPLPQGWDLVPVDRGAAMVAAEPKRPDGAGFRANLVLTVADNADLSFRDWQVGTDELLARQLVDYQLLDLERRGLCGHQGGRRLAQHVVDGSTPVTMEQWFAQVGTTGYTLTATVDTWRYDELADLFAEVADRLVLPAEDHAVEPVEPPGESP